MNVMVSVAIVMLVKLAMLLAQVKVVNKETQGPFDLVAKIHKEYKTNTSFFRSVVGIKHKRNLLPILWQS